MLYNIFLWRVINEVYSVVRTDQTSGFEDLFRSDINACEKDH